jgi:hypothetical protein
MTYCPEWEDLFKRRPDACVESADYRRKVEKWLATLEEIRKRGVQVTTKQFPEGAHRVLLSLNGDDGMREKTLNYICHKLERGEKITAPDLKKSIAVWEGKAASTSCPVVRNKTNVLSVTPDPGEKSDKPVPPAAVTVPIPSDPAKPVQPSLGESIRRQELQQAGQNQPQDPPFKTGNEIAQGLTYVPPPPKDPAADPAKILREKRLALADGLMETYSERFQMECRDWLRSNNKGAKTNADFFYFAGVELIEKKPGRKP